MAVTAVLILLFTGCVSRLAEPPMPERPRSLEARCPAIVGLFGDTGDDRDRATRAAHRFLRFIDEETYDGRAAWRMLDERLIQRMGWSSAAEFIASDEGAPQDFDDVTVSRSAISVARVGGPGSMPRPKYRDFLLARAGITADECPENGRARLARATWFVWIAPDGGIAPAYVLVVHRTSGYRVLATDV